MFSAKFHNIVECEYQMLNVYKMLKFDDQSTSNAVFQNSGSPCVFGMQWEQILLFYPDLYGNKCIISLFYIVSFNY